MTFLIRSFFILSVFLSSTQALGFMCRATLAPQSLEHHIDTVLENDTATYRRKVKTLHLYLMQTKPILTDFDASTLFRFVQEEETMRPPQSLRERRLYSQDRLEALPVRLENTSYENQILAYLISQRLDSSFTTPWKASQMESWMSELNRSLKRQWPHKNSTRIIERWLRILKNKA